MAQIPKIPIKDEIQFTGIEDTPVLGPNWASLIFDSYSRAEVQNAVKSEEWQGLRKALIGTTLETKFKVLTDYVLTEDRSETEQELVRCRVTNYVHALRRGGLIK